ncbi:MAG: N-acetylneuraminate synthase family protein, partial [Rhodospirillaceae bacterium]|nr:N-acetylneuraminate synthase family protein [Rhodospirillaceae bacterium]
MQVEQPIRQVRFGFGKELTLADHHPYITVIAEAGVNHNGSLEMACELASVAAKSGADYVKYQTFIAERVAAPSAHQAAYQEASGTAGQSQLDLIRNFELS